jgi:hypothetical protein
MWTLSDEVQYLGSRLQSRRNAFKHGLTAETVIEPLENPEEYRVFEEAIVSEYLPQTPVERELLHRLASLFWRLRPATSIRDRPVAEAKSLAGEGTPRAFAGTGPEFGLDVVSDANGEQQLHPGGSRAASASRDIALSFLRLANPDSEIADRLSRYEAALWRQLAQTLFALQALKHR